MIIYDAEKNAGLSEQLIENNSIAFVAVAREIKDIDEPTQEKLLKANLRAFATNQNQPDLYCLDTILVSTGWNKNDDVFDRAEIWNARSSPEDKPFNYEHNEKDIIGHITANFPVNENYEILTEDLTIDNLPSIFHLRTSAVLYKHWSDAELQKRMDKIIAEIPKGEWYVSMEALFNNFDYAIIDTKTKAQKVVSRNYETAFLTKHLRSFGGDGVYQNLQVGRLLRGITFSGKGLVRKPANPNSIILTNASALFNGTIQNKMENTVMSDTATAELSKEIATLNVKLADEAKSRAALEDKIKKHEADAHTAQTKAVEDANKAKDETLAKLQTKVDELVVAVENSKATIKTITDSKNEIDAAFQDMLKEKEKMLKDKKTKSRLEALVKAGAVETDAQGMVDKFDALDDDQFNAVVALVKPVSKEGGNKPDVTKASQDAINNAELEQVAPLNEDGKTVASELSDKLSDAFGSMFRSTAKLKNLNK